MEGEEAAEYAALVAADTNREIAAMEMTWADKLEHKGWERGRQDGRQEGIREGHQRGIREGRQEGVRKGRQEGIRAVVLDLLEARFGSLPKKLRRRVEAIDSTEELSRLARRVVTAGSLAELGLDGR